VLAIWDGDRLRLAHDQPGLGGYGGDIAALPHVSASGFAVGCPRANALALFSARGHFVDVIAHAQSCALACQGGPWWNAGATGALTEAQRFELDWSRKSGVARATPNLQIDNHWQLT
jgi:uncharacterized protein